MTPRLHRALSGLTLTALATVAVGATASPALAASGDIEVVNTETVQIYTSSTGAVEEARVYEQLSMFGNGTVDVRNPVSTDGLRNLNGFGGFDVKDGEQLVKTTVDGTKKVRSVSAYDGKLPLDVKVAYKLDGASVKPGDVVGGDGKLEVVYTVENITGEAQEVTIPDGKGGMVTKTAEVAIPIVGSLTTVTPSNFTNVESDQANRAGDGKGGTKLSFTMTLFPPIGSTTAVFGYTADVVDGVIPRADISALPVNPLDVPTFKSANASYQGGADTGAKLTDGAIEIDANLLKLRDGAGDLLAGLIKLRDGANELNAGLSGKAAPGAQKLAAGAGDLNDGLGQINDGSARLYAGTGQLADGATKLAAGANKAADGSGRLYVGTQDLSTGANDLAKGATTIDGFMKQLSGGQGDLLDGLRLLESSVKVLPDTVADKLKTDPQYQALLGGMQSVVDGIGDCADPKNVAPTNLCGGLNAIRGGLETQVSPGLGAILEGLPAKQQSLTCASLILEDLTGGAPAQGACFPPNKVRPPLAAETNPYNIAVLTSMAAQLQDGATGLEDLSTGLTGMKSAIDDKFVPGLKGIKGGLYNPGASQNCAAAKATSTAADDCGVQQAVAFFKASMPTLVTGITSSIRTSLLAGISAPGGGCQPDSKTLICGAEALAGGGAQLAGGTGDLSAGAGKLSAGAGLLSSKTGELADGLGQISDGAGKLSAGSGELNAGAQKLADGVAKAFDGSGLLADGAQTLSDGLQEAANGSGLLAEGLGTAADGAPKLRDGAQRLSDEGTKKLIEAGEATTLSYGEMVAVMKAGADRADAEKMAYGAPDDALGLTAYSYVISGDDGESGRNWARGLGGLALLGAGGGVFALRRRLF